MLGAAVVGLTLLAVSQSAPVPPAPKYRMSDDSETPIPAIPPEFRSIISGATRDTLTLRALDGRKIPVAISGYRVWVYRLYQNGRYFGMELSGYEVFGYVLVDRAALNDNVIETGNAPLLSDDGRWFAVAGKTDADQGNFEGIGLWEVGPRSSTRRFFTNALPSGSQWQNERWVGNCFSFSAFLDSGEGYEEKRSSISLWVKPSITLQYSFDEPPCNESTRP